MPEERSQVSLELSCFIALYDEQASLVHSRFDIIYFNLNSNKEES